MSWTEVTDMSCKMCVVMYHCQGAHEAGGYLVLMCCRTPFSSDQLWRIAETRMSCSQKTKSGRRIHAIFTTTWNHLCRRVYDHYNHVLSPCLLLRPACSTTSIAYCASLPPPHFTPQTHAARADAHRMPLPSTTFVLPRALLPLYYYHCMTIYVLLPCVFWRTHF